MVEKYRSRHDGWNVKHFHSWYRKEGGSRSYTWVKKTLQYSGWGNLDKKQGGFKKIMSSVRKHYSTDLKVKIVLEILKEERSVTQLASDHKIHYSQLLKWKKQAMEGLPDLFSDSRTEALKTTHEKEVMALYQEIGQLTTQLAWLKKKSGIA